jgi:hypothetical protein
MEGSVREGEPRFPALTGNQAGTESKKRGEEDREVEDQGRGEKGGKEAGETINFSSKL